MRLRPGARLAVQLRPDGDFADSMIQTIHRQGPGNPLRTLPAKNKFTLCTPLLSSLPYF
jgi:hypothetical protein